MSKRIPSLCEFPSRIRRRCALPLASAVAALGLAGCNAMQAPPSAAAPIPPERQAADQKVRQFTSDIELALDKVDRERLRAAAEKKAPPAPSGSSSPASPTPVSPTSISPAPVAVAPVSPAPSPAAASPSMAQPQASGVLASSGSGETTPVAHAMLPAEPHAALSPQIPTASPASIPVSRLKTISESPKVEPSTEAPPTESPQIASAPIVSPSSPPPPFAPEKPEPAPTPLASSPLTGVTLAAPATATPVSGQTPSAVISPINPMAASSASAMGSMDSVFVPPTNYTSALSSPGVSTGAAEPSLDDAMAVVRKNASAHPSLATALALSLLDTSSSADLSKSLPDSDQKLLTDLVAALETLKTAPPGATLSDRAAPLLNAAKKWQADADLALPRLVLATRVDSFGVFTPIDAKFEQGKRHTVIIYCEVANFTSQKGDDGWFTTRLAQQETLITEDGLLVWRPNPEEIEDRSMNQRHDFYLVKKLTIPENLAAGKYTLRMSVTDHTNNKISMVSLPLEIAAK